MEGDVGSLDPELRPGIFPYGFWSELRSLFKLAWPLSLSMLFHYLIQPISIAFCGHLGKTELASVAMAISVIYVVVVSIGRGLAFGGDTFFAQTYGSDNKKNVGVYLQKGFIFAVLWTMPIIAILLNTENLLLLIRQDPDIAKLAQVYTQLFCPGAFAYCCLFMVMRYLLCQNRVLPIMLICIVSCGVNAVLNYGLVYQADMGIKGSAIALCLTYYLVLILMLSYILGMKLYTETWDGWSFKCLEEWGEFSRVTSFSIFMTFLFWICTEVGTFLGGVLSPRDLSAFSISFQIEGFAWMIPLGIGGACTARLGQHLGANKPRAALNSARVALLVVVFISIIMGVLCFVLRHYIPLAFTSNKDLIDYTASILRITTLFLVMEGFGGVGMSIIRGTGRQALGSVIVLISYFVVAWPIGIPLMFATHLGLAGLWWGFDLGLFTQDFFIVLFILKLNWNKEAEKALARSQLTDKINQTVQRQEADETTRLLNNVAEATTNNNINKSLSSIEISNSNRESRLKIIFKRSLVFLGFSLTLVAGVLTRLYVEVPISWTPLCIEKNDTVIETTVGNSTLPFCDDVEIHPVLGIWV